MSPQRREASTAQASPPAARDPYARDEAMDPGAYIGRKPERVAESIAGGISRKDERIAAVDTQTGAPAADETTPAGHRGGRPTTDAQVREAGQDR